MLRFFCCSVVCIFHLIINNLTSHFLLAVETSQVGIFTPWAQTLAGEARVPHTCTHVHVHVHVHVVTPVESLYSHVHVYRYMCVTQSYEMTLKSMYMYSVHVL